MNYSKNWGESTDVEDFDSQAEQSKPSSRKSSLNPLKSSRQVQHDLTDVEDYDASDSEIEVDAVEKETVYPELKVSLEEFLEQGAQALQSLNNGVMERVERRSGNFLQAQNLTSLTDYLTDCEDYNTDSDLESECVKSVCVDLNETLVDQGRVSIADATSIPEGKDDSEDDNEEVSVASNISNLISDVAGVKGLIAPILSEDEMLELSGDEEICHIAFSDTDSKDEDESVSDSDLRRQSSVAPIDVTFIQSLNLLNRTTVKTTCTQVPNCATKTKFLDVEQKKEEVLTDIERLDDDDEDSYDDDENPIPQAVVLAAGVEGDCLTDCEDVSCEDVSTAESSGREREMPVDMKALPQPQREIVLLQEDKFGDTITSVMPMDEEFQFGMSSLVKEEQATDSEEYSCVEDDELTEVSVAEAPLSSPAGLIESDITVSNEQMKPHISKRLEIQSNTESVTDIEEFYMDGTNVRRKKLKTRSMSKGKSKYLDVTKAPEGGATDVEDMDLSETELSHDLKFTLKPNAIISPSHADKATDVEDLTTDLSSASEADLPQIDRMSSNLKDYDASSSNVVIALETCVAASNTKPKKMSQSPKLRNNVSQQHQQQQTDTEDVQLPSDTEDYLPPEPLATNLSHELNEMLNASCTTVHEKCQSSFNVDAEKIHIKGMLREAHTDVEYVESDESAARGSK